MSRDTETAEAQLSHRLTVMPAVGLDGLSDEWADLALASGRVFSTPEWATAWWDVYGRGRQPLVLPARDADGRVAGIVPLYVGRRSGVRMARFIGHGAADELGPVCGTDDRAAVAAALLEALESGALGVDLLLAEAVPGVEGWHDLLEGTVFNVVASPTILFETDDWDAYLGSLSANLRGQIRQRERRLFRDLAAVYRETVDADSLERDMDDFLALHSARWGAASSLLGRADFYRRFAGRALERGWLRLSFLDIEGRPAAASLDFRYGGIQFHYNSGRDPRWDQYSAGLVLRAMTLRDALTAGVREYRFLRGDEPYKSRFATGDRGSVTFARSATALGRLAVAATARLAGSGRARRVLRRAGSG